MAGGVTPAQMPALHQADMVGKDARQKTLPALSLDHGRVLSQWEKLGGKVEFEPDSAIQDALSNPLDPSHFFGPGDVERCSILQEGLGGSVQPPTWLDLGGTLSTEALAPQARLIVEPGCSAAASSLDSLTGEWQLAEDGQLWFDDFGWAAAEAGRITMAGEQAGDCWVGEKTLDMAGVGNQLADAKQQTSEAPLAAPVFNVVSSGPVTGTAPPRGPATKVEVCASNAQQVAAPATRPFPSTTRMGFANGESSAAFIVPFSGRVASMQGANCLKDGRTRTQCLQRYREKKARRLYTKKIRYELRKINADRRPRIKGRFVKKEELQEYLRLQQAPKEKVAEHTSMDSNDFEDSEKAEDTAVRI
ncbi:unnamed protein product [Ostreobium quekettii]|uniref:CCT domain-containing protein n=1 Tax=Ostreobium quekettii TaxID=121088 RepID=A0A8S1IRK6_9CHLO|nr:unnamed protein product [Ostreobium quekettii]